MKPLFAPLPAKLSWYQPVVLLATWFGFGRLPYAPGTWGSLGVLPLAIVALNLGIIFGVVVSITIFAIGVWAATVYVRITCKEDPPEIVIDEAAGQCLSLCFVHLTPLGVAAAIFLFRFFDICKPFPIGWIEIRFPSGWAIMLDDVMAAIYTGAILLLLHQFDLL